MKPIDELKGTTFLVQGVKITLFSIGQIADALGIDAKEFYRWRRRGLFPDAIFKTSTPTMRGSRGWYTREQVEGVVKIAKEEGVCAPNFRDPQTTQFFQRATELIGQSASEYAAEEGT